MESRKFYCQHEANDLISHFCSDSLQEKQQQAPAEIKVNEGKKSQLPMESIAPPVSSSRSASPRKSPLKALPVAVEALKASAPSNNAKAKPADAENNNKSTEPAPDDDDDDDSVFINESKQKKAKNTGAASAPNVSSSKASNAKASGVSSKPSSQNHNSRESNVQSETTVR
jgi:hypothetical protein